MTYSVCIGRWSPPHLGHVALWRTVHEKTGNPVLVMVRDTFFDTAPAAVRADLVRLALKDAKIPGRVLMIPDIDGVYYGRGVGYAVEEVPVDGVGDVSGTKIRELREADDDAWKAMVSPSVAAEMDRLP